MSTHYRSCVAKSTSALRPSLPTHHDVKKKKKKQIPLSPPKIYQIPQEYIYERLLLVKTLIFDSATFFSILLLPSADLESVSSAAEIPGKFPHTEVNSRVSIEQVDCFWSPIPIFDSFPVRFVFFGAVWSCFIDSEKKKMRKRGKIEFN